MQDQIVHSMRSVFPYIVAFGIFGQVVLAVIMLWIAQGRLVIERSRDKEVEAEFEDRLHRARRTCEDNERRKQSRKAEGLDVEP